MVKSDLLSNYKNLTLEMIEKIKADNDISLLVKKREEILKEIMKSDINKQSINKDSEIANIQKLDEELQKIVKTKMIDIKKDMKKIQQSKAAFNQYSNFNGNAMIFSTQI